jgi:hypothetical protein
MAAMFRGFLMGPVLNDDLSKVNGLPPARNSFRARLFCRKPRKEKD